MRSPPHLNQVRPVRRGDTEISHMSTLQQRHERFRLSELQDQDCDSLQDEVQPEEQNGISDQKSSARPVETRQRRSRSDKSVEDARVAGEGYHPKQQQRLRLQGRNDENRRHKRPADSL